MVRKVLYFVALIRVDGQVVNVRLRLVLGVVGFVGDGFVPLMGQLRFQRRISFQPLLLAGRLRSLFLFLRHDRPSIGVD